ncbi:MAG: hypothetical protein WCF57_13905 [Pyrinomonadaceae bacterium]
MTKIRFTLNAMAALVILMAASSLANAQATRTWVSGVGDDVNPCSRTAPCKTFAGAISKTAAAGEISVLDPGGFGAVTITKSITIDGGGIGGSILAALVNGVIINLPNATDRVILRNLSINGAGNGLNGIRFIQNGRLHVENCTIFGFGGSTGRGIDFAPTALNTALTVKNTSIRENFGAGISFTPAATGSVNATIDNVEVENSQNGIIANDKTKVMISHTRAAHNVASGFVAVGSANGNPEMFIESSTAAHNGTNGVRTQGTGTPKIRISNVAITNNATGISIGVGEVRSFGNNHNDGNGAGPANNGAPTAGNILPQ